MKVKSESEAAQSCLTLSDPMDCSPPGSLVHGIFQAFGLKLALWNVENVLNIKKAELYIIIHGNFLNVRVSYHRTYTLEIK